MKGEDVLDALRARRLRATPQRIALLTVLRASRAPLSVEALLKRLEGELDQATAYRALQEFERAGLARRTAFKGATALYEAAGVHHHHLMCRSCGAIEDVEVCLPASMTRKLLSESKRFVAVDDHALEFFGTCRACSTL